MSETPVEDMTFEQAMSELERVVGQLERGDVALDQSIALYERGALLEKALRSKIEGSRRKSGRHHIGCDRHTDRHRAA